MCGFSYPRQPDSCPSTGGGVLLTLTLPMMSLSLMSCFINLHVLIMYVFSILFVVIIFIFTLAVVSC